MKPFRGVFSARPYGSEPNGNGELRLAAPAPVAEVAPGLVSPRPGPKHLLWEVLVELGFVDEHRVLEAEAVARASRQDLAAVLLERGLVSSEQLARAVAQREGVLFVDLERYAVDERAASLITPAVAERYGAIPIGFGPGGEVLLALANPRDRHAVNDISMMVDPSVTRVVATQESIDALIRARKEATYETEPVEGSDDASTAAEAELAELSPDSADGLWYPLAEAGDTGAAADEVGADTAARDALTSNGVAEDSFAPGGAEPEAVAPERSALEGLTLAESEPAGASESLQWFEAEGPLTPPSEEEADASLAAGVQDGSEVVEVSDLGATVVGGASTPAEPDASEASRLDRELLESLTATVEKVDRLVAEAARAREAELEVTAAGSADDLAELTAETERDRSQHAEAERALRDQLEAERAARGESESRLREDAERERASREQSERGLRAEFETERAERAESERTLREELETERATREALATEIAAVRTARDDLARRVASARDLLELGARPFVPLNGRER